MYKCGSKTIVLQNHFGVRYLPISLEKTCYSWSVQVELIKGAWGLFSTFIRHIIAKHVS